MEERIEPISEPSLLAESTEDRLRRLELAMATMHPGNAPDGYAPSAPGGVIPLLLMVNAAVDPDATWRRMLRDLPVLRELRLIAQMYLDPRYRLSRLGQFGVPLIVAFAVLNYMIFNHIFPSIPLVSPIIERMLLLILGAGLAILLNREAMRYQAVIDYLARVGR